MAAFGDDQLVKEFSKLVSSSFGLFLRSVMLYDKQQHPFSSNELSNKVLEYKINEYYSGAAKNRPSTGSFRATAFRHHQQPAMNTGSFNLMASNGPPSSVSNQQQSEVISNASQPTTEQIRLDLDRDKQVLISEREKLDRERAQLDEEKRRATNETANRSFLGSFFNGSKS